MGKDNLRDGRVRNWFYLENDLLDKQDLTIYEKMIYIVIARYVDKEDKAFPSIPTIAKKGSMSERQVQMIINSLVKKGLIKKESRINKYNKSKTSNLYTLLSVKRNQSDKDKGDEVVHDMHHPGEHGAPPLVNEVHPNNTNLKNTNLNNVSTTSNKEVVENSENEIKEYPKFKRYRFREKEQLAREIAEELNDNHSLGAFRVVVDKISEQRIRIFLSIIKDTYITGKIRKNRGAMFVSLAKVYAGKNNINLNFR